METTGLFEILAHIYQTTQRLCEVSDVRSVIQRSVSVTYTPLPLARDSPFVNLEAPPRQC